MRKLAILIPTGMLAMLGLASAQAPPSTRPTLLRPAAYRTNPIQVQKGTTPTYDRTLLRPSVLKEKAPETFQVKFETTRGDFTMNVTRSWAPIGVDRFYNLVKHHFYDNMVIFRVVPGFVVQFGISSYPAVSSAWGNANVKDDPVTQSNKRGFVTFAKTQTPNSRSTQIFISFKDNSFLDSQGFAPFAEIDATGMKVVEMFYDQYGDQPTSEQDQIARTGKPYLDSKYPKLDVIKHATLVGAVGTASAKPAAAKAPAPPVTKPQ